MAAIHPTSERLSARFPRVPISCAIIGDSSIKYVHETFNPLEPGTPAFVSYRGARFNDVLGLLHRLPPTLPRLVIHVGTVDIADNGCAQRWRTSKNSLRESTRSDHTWKFALACRYRSPEPPTPRSEQERGLPFRSPSAPPLPSEGTGTSRWHPLVSQPARNGALAGAGSPVPGENMAPADSSSSRTPVPPVPRPVIAPTSPTTTYNLRSYSEAARRPAQPKVN
ncbi:hypothetical protein HPB52_024352 [Rhipicephalus sanguineus]|uniref:Uncharacterized protein n=1 Tax=Rhipicephalus sanguineus TaxID=34632 RepID=A0A9D4TCI1_RHISA|nr:hypothetical protein HPB52_024352 [Rhipicephalus sanguineus]